MPTLRHLLFPYDFSEGGAQVVPYVRAFAESFGAHVTIIGVVPPAFDPTPAAMGDVRAASDATEWVRTLQGRLDGALLSEFAGLPVSRVAEGGDPAIRIVDFAQRNGVDMIMMPTHGIGRFRSLLVGSVTAKVLHDARCPVWTARHAESQHAATRPRRILCAVDGSPATPALACWAHEFAQALGAPLTLQHVVGPISDWPSLERERQLQEEVRDEARMTIASMVNGAGVSVPLRVGVGSIVPTVTEEAVRVHADLIVVGRGRLCEAFGRLKTHAFGIIQRSPCPVISV